MTTNSLHEATSGINSAANKSPFTHPEFFPIPARGLDPYFGIGRSSYYDLERRGLLRLIRIRKPGNIRGRVLVPYADVAALIRKLSEDGSKAA